MSLFEIIFKHCGAVKFALTFLKLRSILLVVLMNEHPHFPCIVFLILAVQSSSNTSSLLAASISMYLDRKPHFCALQRRDLSSKWENSTSMKLLRREQKSRTVVASVVSYVFRYNNFDTPCYWCSSSDIKSASKFGECVSYFCIIWPRAKYRIVFGCGEFDHCVRNCKEGDNTNMYPGGQSSCKKHCIWAFIL